MTNTQSNMANPEAEIGTIFDVLTHRRRRYILYELQHHDEELSTQHLAMTVAAWETERSQSAVEATDYRRVFTALHHAHLPKLADANAIAYDEAQQQVSLQDHPPLLETCLHASASRELE